MGCPQLEINFSYFYHLNIFSLGKVVIVMLIMDIR